MKNFGLRSSNDDEAWFHADLRIRGQDCLAGLINAHSNGNRRRHFACNGRRWSWGRRMAKWVVLHQADIRILIEKTAGQEERPNEQNGPCHHATHCDTFEPE